MSLFGPGGASKSTIAEGLAVSLSTGIEIVPDWRPTRGYVVILLDAQDELTVRFQTYKRAGRHRGLLQRDADRYAWRWTADMDKPSGPKVPADRTLAVILDAPGIDYHRLAASLGVTWKTARGYVERLVAEGRVTVRREVHATPTGPRVFAAVYPDSPEERGNGGERGNEHDSPVSPLLWGERTENGGEVRSPYRGSPVLSSPVLPASSEAVQTARDVFGDDLTDPDDKL